MAVDRSEWMDHVRSVLRSRHYQWLPEGLGGEPVDVAMTYMLTDIRHVCRMGGINFDELLERSRREFLKEESQIA
jgi:hypothetical protein